MNELTQDFLFDVARIAENAGKLIMGYFRQSFQQSSKPDGSVVTTADREADALICRALKVLIPDIPIISEEGDLGNFASHSLFWLVDPLDGTSQFVRGREEFTVNIALIRHGVPVLGVIYHPPTEKMYAAYDDHLFIGKGSELHPLDTRGPKRDVVIIGNARERGPEFDAVLAKHGLSSAQVLVLPSSLKFCVMAEGNACFQYRARPSSEWDIAAGHALIAARGGKILTFSGDDLIYGKEDYKNSGFIAVLPRT